MTTLSAGALAAFIAYFIGSLPFGYLTAKLVRGIDIREHGSRNIGATNAARVLGAKWGIAVLVLDALKGALPVLLLPKLFLGETAPGILHAHVACGVAAMLGHMFPCWLRFRGGKGVATAAGIVLVLAPWASLGAIATFGVVFAVSRIVSLSSILGVTAFAVLQMVWLRPHPFSAETWSLALFSLVAPALIIYRHRPNIGRLLRGEEPKFRAAGSNGQEGRGLNSPPCAAAEMRSEHCIGKNSADLDLVGQHEMFGGVAGRVGRQLLVVIRRGAAGNDYFARDDFHAQAANLAACSGAHMALDELRQ
jgi:glycerol-3-phosphate acyltransferase PlsY